MAKTTKGTWRIKVLRAWSWRPEGAAFHTSYREGWEGPVPEASALAGEAAGAFEILRRPAKPRRETGET